MSDISVDESVEEEIDVDEEESEKESKWLSTKSLMLIAAVALVLLIGGAGAGVYFGGFLDMNAEPDQPDETPDSIVFYDLPAMIVNLGKGKKKQTYLKIRFSLELDETEDLKTLERLLPRVIDHFQVYLRELRVDDLHGSAGLYRLKEELLRRVSVAAHPVKIRDVLFKEMLIQ